MPLATLLPDVLGRNGTFIGVRKYQSRVGAFNRSETMVKRTKNASCWPQNWLAVGAAARH